MQAFNGMVLQISQFEDSMRMILTSSEAFRGDIFSAVIK